MLQATDLAARIDHTALKPETSAQQVVQLCKEALEYSFSSVCVNPARVRLAAEHVTGSPVEVCSVIGFPFGASASALKAAEAERALHDGATEIDMVINIGLLRDGDEAAVRDDIAEVRHVMGAGVILKVIIEAAVLGPDEIVSACLVAVDAGADFIKTSTGFHPAGGARLDDVRLMRRTVGDRARIKAAGGIRDLAAALAMIEAGADRLGTSSSVAIMRELQGTQARS